MGAKKKLIFCTYSSIYSSTVLEQILADDGIELVAIINSKRVLDPLYGHLRGAIEQIKISGLRYSTYLFLITDFFRWMQTLLVLKKWSLGNVHALAKQHAIPLLDTRDINNTQSIDFIRKFMPEYLLAAHFNQLIKSPVLSIPEIECVNIHPSLLPAYKGVDPVFHALCDNNKHIGVTVHRMSDTFDSGEILMQLSVSADQSKSLLFNNCQLFKEGIKLALQWMKNNRVKQKLSDDEEKPIDSYDSWPNAAEVKNFRQSGKRLIHLSELWKQ